ncbi:hypothetical protein N1851_003814 [Merluccius polli]|uniref:Uncharacterized protein n=1 Tax=Merluccius polli TaxID=89951 RepID=A0AA47N9P7_MERPO|nr:hypothetical protein N1851_003814 [Merluccius polli]
MLLCDKNWLKMYLVLRRGLPPSWGSLSSARISLHAPEVSVYQWWRVVMVMIVGWLLRVCLLRPDASVSFLLRRQQKRIHRGCRGGLRDRLRLAPHKTALPSIFLANVRSLVNKMDELRLRITTNKRIMDCNLLIFTETWLNPSVPDNAINLAERNIFRADRTADSGKSKGGGLCIYVNNAWCTNSSIIESHCSEKR